MATDYTTLAAVKADLSGMTSTDNDASLTAKITIASRAIDQMTRTTFYSIVETREFDTDCRHQVYVDRFTDSTGLVVATGRLGDYSTVLTADDYLLWPRNAPSHGLAWQRIDVPAALLEVPLRRTPDWPTVQVTAAWGWDYIPDQVEEATRLFAIHLFQRRDAPHGTAGYADDPAAVERIVGEDADVMRLLEPYLRRPYVELGIA